MPNIITHTLFADEMLEKLNNELLTSRKQLFEVGSNGPDFLFFHNLTPTSFLKTNKLRKLGSAIHKGKINEFYRKAIDIIRNEKDPEIQKDINEQVEVVTRNALKPVEQEMQERAAAKGGKK
ncbi:MAG: hypothetical protein HUJ53_01235 [Holdemanella sp.]|nr:hypothetical protein [Holdemanella sp.]